jgi:hypothetical protein
MGRASKFRTALIVTAFVASLAGCGDDATTEAADPRNDAIRACVKSDPTLDRKSCSCLVDELGLTVGEVEDLDELEMASVADPNAEIERILGPRRAAVLLTTTAECNAQ